MYVFIICINTQFKVERAPRSKASVSVGDQVKKSVGMRFELMDDLN